MLKTDKEVVLTFYWDARAIFEDEDENTSTELTENYVGETWQECCDDCASGWDWDDSDLVTSESNVIETSRNLMKIIIRRNGEEKEASQEVYDYYEKEEERKTEEGT